MVDGIACAYKSAGCKVKIKSLIRRIRHESICPYESRPVVHVDPDTAGPESVAGDLPPMSDGAAAGSEPVLQDDVSMPAIADEEPEVSASEVGRIETGRSGITCCVGRGGKLADGDGSKAEVVDEAEVAKSLLASFIMESRGKLLSWNCVNRLLGIVTTIGFAPAKTALSFYNAYTVRKYQREKEEEEIRSHGFSHLDVQVLQKELPGCGIVQKKKRKSVVGQSSTVEPVLDSSDSDSGGKDEDQEDDSDDDDGDEFQYSALEDDGAGAPESSLSAVLYFRDSKKQMEEMINGATVGVDMFLEGEAQYKENRAGVRERYYGGPMSSDLAVDAFPEVAKYIASQISDDGSVCWLTGSYDEGGMQSVCLGSYVYTDKSDASRWQMFYPVHLCSTNFSSSYTQRMIDSGKTIVGFLPTTFFRKGGFPASLQQLGKSYLLHECMEKCFDPLAACTLPGIATHGGKLVNHPILVNMVTDWPEQKLMSCTKDSIETAKPCSRCSVRRGRLTDSTDVTKKFRKYCDVERTRSEAVALVEKANGMKRGSGVTAAREKGESIAKRQSLQFATPFYRVWEFVDGQVHALLDAQRLFGFERLHNLPKGTQCLIFVSSLNLLFYSGIKMPAILLKSGDPMSAKKCGNGAIGSLNTFLTETHHFSPMPDTRLDYSANGGYFTRSKGKKSKPGVIDMTEAKDNLSVLTVMPFIGMILDAYLGMPGEGHFTSLFTMYTTISQQINGRYISDDCYFFEEGFSESDLDNLAKLISDFKLLAVQLFGGVEGHGLETHKLHLLDHVVSDLRRLGYFFVMASDSWEAAHNRLKIAYRGTSRLNNSYVWDTINALESSETEKRTELESEIGDEDLGGSTVLVGQLKASAKDLEAMVSDSASLETMGDAMTLRGLKKACHGQDAFRGREVPMDLVGFLPVETIGTALQMRPELGKGVYGGAKTSTASPRRKVSEELGKYLSEKFGNLMCEKARELKRKEAGPCDDEADLVYVRSGANVIIDDVPFKRISSGRVESRGTPDLSSLRRVCHCEIPDSARWAVKRRKHDPENPPAVFECPVAREAGGDCPTSELVIRMRDEGRRRLDSIVANGCYYGRPRHDTVFVELADDGVVLPSLIAGVAQDYGHDSTTVYPVRIISLFNIPVLSSVCNEWALVQYFEVVDHEKLLNGGGQEDEAEACGSPRTGGPSVIGTGPDLGSEKQVYSEHGQYDAVLKFIRLRYATQAGEPYYDLLPVTCFHGKAQFVRVSQALWTLACREDVADSWAEDFFYINRYCTQGPNQMYNLSDVASA